MNLWNTEVLKATRPFHMIISGKSAKGISRSNSLLYELQSTGMSLPAEVMESSSLGRQCGLFCISTGLNLIICTRSYKPYKTILWSEGLNGFCFWDYKDIVQI